MIKCNIAVILLTLLSSNTYAQYYLNVGGGAVFPGKGLSYTADSSSTIYSPTSIGTSIFSLPDVNWQNNYKNGWDLNAAIGSIFKERWLGEFEFLYQHFNREIGGQYGWRESHLNGDLFAQYYDNYMTAVSSSTNLYSALINGSYKFNSFGKLIPILGLGAGIAWINSPTTTADGILNVDDPTTPLKESAPVIQRGGSLGGAAFACQLKAGLGYDWSKVTTILQYRLFATTKFRISQSSFTTNDGIPGAEATFYVPGQKISGIVTNAVEIVFQFKI